MTEPLDRRAFLARATRRAGALALATGMAGAPYGLSRALAPAQEDPFPDRREPEHRIPLPGALADPAAFADACIGCALCAEVCPPRAVRMHRREGGVLANTPYIDPTRRGCTLCGKCMEICPTNALTPVPREAVRMGTAQIDRAACYPWVDRGVCGACALVCPLGERAIGFEFARMYRPIVRAEGCVGCGLCVEVCPHPSRPIRIVGRGEPTVATHRV